jgi:hypothetical protein
MRSELIFKAVSQEPNRYLLTRLLAKGTRKMHRPNTRIEDTTNLLLEQFHSLSPKAEVRRPEPERMEDLYAA